MTPVDASTLASWFQAILAVTERAGGSRAGALAAAGLDAAQLDQPRARQPVSKLSKLWRHAYELCGTTVGLQVAREFRPRHWSAVGLALMSSRDLDEALVRMSRYSSLITDAVEVRYEPSRVASRRVATRILPPVELEAERTEAYVGSALLLARLMYDARLTPVRVDLLRRRPDDVSPWTGIFGENIAWEAPEMAVHFSAEQLAMPTPSADLRMAEMHEQLLSDYMGQIEATSLPHRVRLEILRALPTREPGLDDLADRLLISRRSLQRHLEQEGLSFRGLVDDIRRHAAQDYLRNSDRSLKEITFLLGFANQANFSNAFKRWTGLSPSVYRLQPRD